MLCEKCGEREAEFVSPGNWCEVCWAEWWFEGMLPEDETVREELIEEASALFKNMIEITKLPKEERPAAIREIAKRIVQPAGPS